MSAKRSVLTLVVGVLAASGLALLFAAANADQAVDVEVRTTPWRTQSGRLDDTTPLGQGFRCRWNGLASIDLGVAGLGPTQDAPLELLLHANSLEGDVLRRAQIAPAELPGGRGFVSFEFEPVVDSAGRDFWFELAIPGEAQRSNYSAWIRYHGQPGVEAPWGNRILEGTVFEGPLRNCQYALDDPKSHVEVPHPLLASVAFAFERLNPAHGPVLFELWDEGADPLLEAPLRSVPLQPEQLVLGGYAYFAFEPVALSRWRKMTYRLTLNSDARLVGLTTGPSLKTFHGRTAVEPPLLGMSQGSRVYTDRSLVFRARSSPSRAEVFALIRQRAGWKLWAGALCWVLGLAVSLRLLSPR